MKELAQANKPLGDFFYGSGSHPFEQLTGVSSLVTLVVRAGFVISGVLILFFFVLGGFQIIAGAGSNNPEAAKKGQQAASAAALGFAVVFVAYWIVRLIEVITGVKIVS